MEKFMLITVYNNGEIFCKFANALFLEDVCKEESEKQEKMRCWTLSPNNPAPNWGRVNGKIHVFCEKWRTGEMEEYPRGEIKFSKDGVEYSYDK
jgi:hypothetical protein